MLNVKLQDLFIIIKEIKKNVTNLLQILSNGENINMSGRIMAQL